MKIFLKVIPVKIFLLVFLCHLQAQTTTNIPGSFEQTISDYKMRIDECLNGISGKDGTKETKASAAFSTSYLFQSYDQFLKGINDNQRFRLMSDSDLSGKLCSLHIVYAEYQLEDAKVEANPPSVTALESAFKEYQLAYASLPSFNDSNETVKNCKKIEDGLAKTIRGLNKYADWFVKDVFMNPEGRKWDANPAPQAEGLRKELVRRGSSLDEMIICRKSLERILKDIKDATERKDGVGALEKMILGARWLTTILQKSPDTFVTEFKKYNLITNPAMEMVRKGFSPEKMKEFSRFYDPLKSHYLVLTTKKK